MICADVVGYSRLMGDDEEWTLARFKNCSEIICRLATTHHGRVFGAAGDSLMAEFVNPVEAVHCAVEIQDAVERINAANPDEPEMLFRLGINIGNVMVVGDDLFGDEVNIAARIQEMAGSGGITVSETVYYHVFDKLDVGFEFLGERRFKNIASPVRVYQALLSSQHSEAAMPAANVDVSSPVPGFHGRPAIAVLPFENLSGDPEQEYLADGLTDDIITGLSQLRWFPLIARNSSFIYRGKPISVIRIGQALGARYLVEGNVRVAGDQLRVSAELIDAETGHQVWSSKFNRKLDDIFKVQEDVATDIIGALDPEIDKAEQFKSAQKPAEQLDTWGMVRRGLWHLYRFTRDDAIEAMQLFETAKEMDPDSSEALIQLGVWHFWSTWAERGSPKGWAEMERLAREAIQIDPSDARPYMLIGVSQVMNGKPSKGRLPLRESLRLNPSQYAAYIGMGTSYILSGEPQNAVEPLSIGMRLSPHDPYAFHTLGELAQAHHMLGEWDDAIEYADKSLRLHPRYWYAQVVRICCLARKGEKTEAGTALAQLLRQRPNFSSNYVKWVPFEKPQWNNELVDGLNMAGLEKHAQAR